MQWRIVFLRLYSALGHPLSAPGAQQAPDHSMSGPMDMPMNGGQMDDGDAGDGAGKRGAFSADDSSAYDIGNERRAELDACANADEDGGRVDVDVPWERISGGAAADESARGGDKFFSTNWFMPMAQRELGPGELTLRAMLSLEPATVTGRQYPLLFQQGETAYGNPIVDGQHPHDFFMELARSTTGMWRRRRCCRCILRRWAIRHWGRRLFRIGLRRRRIRWRRWGIIRKTRRISRMT